MRVVSVLRAAFFALAALVAVLACAAFSRPAYAVIEDPSQIGTTVEGYMSANSFDHEGVAVMAASNSDVMAESYYGYEDKKRKTPINSRSVFEWGEISELLVWVSVLQLEEQGKLDLDADVRIYLPEDFILPIDKAKPITLNQLMNHQAGFDTTPLENTFADPNDPPTLKEALLNADVEQVYDPGTIVAHSRYGAALAAYIVSRVSGLDYETYVRHSILTPMRMYRTAIKANLSDNPEVFKERERMRCYDENGRPLGAMLRYYDLFPAYSVTGSAADLMRLARGIMNVSTEQLFQKPETYKLIFEPTLSYPSPPMARLSHGFYRMPASDDVWFVNGNTPGMSCTLQIHPSTKLAIVVMTNIANDNDFTTQIPELIFGRYTYAPVTYLESPRKWYGVYQQASSAQHGPTKVLSYFERSIVFPLGENDVYLNTVPFQQTSPGIYTNSVIEQWRSRIHIHDDLKFNSVVSIPQEDAFLIPTNRFAFETFLLVGAALSVILSVFALLGAVLRRLGARRRGLMPTTLIAPLVGAAATLVLTVVIAYAAQRILSFSPTGSLKPYLLCCYAYAALATLLVIVIIRRMKTEGDQQSRATVAYRLVTMACLTLVVMNLLYWDIVF